MFPTKINVMKLLEKILVPVYLEENSNSHLETALELALTFKSQLILIHVLPEVAKHKSVKPYLLKLVEKDMDALISKMNLKEGKVKSIIEYGNTFDRIITTAEEEDVNLILFSNFVEHHTGSYSMDVVAEKLVRKSEKPVWMVKEGQGGFPGTMLCTVDYSDASGRALNNAIKIARTFKKKLYILNVLKPIGNNFSPRYTIDFEQENKQLAKKNKVLFDKFMADFNFTDVDYEVKMAEGDPAREILSFVRTMKIDLIFMGATGKTFLQRVMLGSVTEELIRELPSSVVITKSKSILNLKIDSDITELEKHMANAERLEASGYYKEAIHQLNLSVQINDLHIPALNSLARLYDKTGEKEMAENYRKNMENIRKKLWDKKVEFDIRKELGWK